MWYTQVLVNKENKQDIDKKQSPYRGLSFGILSMDFWKLLYSRDRDGLNFGKWLTISSVSEPCYHAQREYNIFVTNDSEGETVAFYSDQKKFEKQIRNHFKENTYTWAILLAWIELYDSWIINNKPYSVTFSCSEFDGICSYEMYIFWGKLMYKINRNGAYPWKPEDVEIWKKLMRKSKFQ
jgi:hypothetical protein